MTINRLSSLQFKCNYWT